MDPTLFKDELFLLRKIASFAPLLNQHFSLSRMRTFHPLTSDRWLRDECKLLDLGLMMMFCAGPCVWPVAALFP